MDSPVDLLMHLRAIIDWFAAWTPSQAVQCAADFTTDDKLFGAAITTTTTSTSTAAGRCYCGRYIRIRHNFYIALKVNVMRGYELMKRKGEKKIN